MKMSRNSPEVSRLNQHFNITWHPVKTSEKNQPSIIFQDEKKTLTQTKKWQLRRLINCNVMWIYHVFAHAQEFDFSWGGSRIQRCENWYRAFTNPFASPSINFSFALKLLRIKDQWDTVLVKCQFVCNRHLSVLTSMPFDGTSSGGKCYGAGRRRLSPGSFQKGLENRERNEK